MKVLVTGGAGFIGSHLVDRFVEEKHTVVVVDNLSTGKQKNIHPKAHFYKVDITGSELRRIFDTEQPEVVSHHAAQVSVQQSVQDPVFDLHLQTACIAQKPNSSLDLLAPPWTLNLS